MNYEETNENNKETHGWVYKLRLIAFIVMCILALGILVYEDEDDDFNAQMEAMDEELQKIDKWMTDHPDSYLGRNW